MSRINPVKPMIVRDRTATLNGEKTVYTMHSGGLQIVIGEQVAWEILVGEGGVLEISSLNSFKEGDTVYYSRFSVRSHASNNLSLVPDAVRKV